MLKWCLCRGQRSGKNVFKNIFIVFMLCPDADANRFCLNFREQSTTVYSYQSLCPKHAPLLPDILGNTVTGPSVIRLI